MQTITMSIRIDTTILASATTACAGQPFYA
jgi:hypothetical protein